MEKYRRTLPEGYREIKVIDIKRDKRVVVWGNVLSVLLMAAAAGIGCLIVPLSEVIRFEFGDIESPLFSLLRLLAALSGSTAVVVLCCLLGAAAMRWCGAEKTEFSITKGMTCALGCDGYFSRRAYVLYALAGTVILAALLLLVALVLPRSWFWVAWFWEMACVSLMGMTLYILWRLRRLPADIWIQDGGEVMRVYALQGIGEMNREG